MGLRERRVIRLSMGMALAGLLVAGCGGSGEDEAGAAIHAPVMTGATEVADTELDDRWYDAFGFDTSDARGRVYRTRASLNEVTAYYSEGIVDEGWTVVASSPLATAHTVMATNGDRVAMLTVMSGATYQIAPGLGGLEDMDITLENVADDETIVTVQEFTCDEDEVADCTFLQP